MWTSSSKSLIYLFTAGLLGSVVGCGSPQGPGETPPDGTPWETPTPGEAGDDDSSAADGTSSPDETTPTESSSPTPDPDGGYLLLVPDNGNNRFVVVDPGREQVVYDLDLARYRPDLCLTVPCLVFGATHLQISGHDFLDISYGMPYYFSFSMGPGFRGNIDRLQLTSPPRLRWRLHELDFSGMPGGSSAYCAADPDDPCAADPRAPYDRQGLCWMGDAHDFEVLWDDPVAQQAELFVVDTDNFRMFKVSLDYAGGNTCGKVTAFVDGERHPDWPVGSQPNNVVPVSRDGRELYLVNQRSIIDRTNTDGDGMLQLWELEGDGDWTLLWTFPEQPREGEPRVLRLPHSGELIPGGHPEGDLYRFADSASLSKRRDYDPMVPTGGSIVTLLIRDIFSPPDYLHDLYQPEEEGFWSFPRDATLPGDGTLLVTDSGCISPGDCPEPARLLWLEANEQTNSSRLGNWTPDHAELHFLDQTDRVVKELQCGFLSPYRAFVIKREQFGEELERLSGEQGAACR